VRQQLTTQIEATYFGMCQKICYLLIKPKNCKTKCNIKGLSKYDYTERILLSDDYWPGFSTITELRNWPEESKIKCIVYNANTNDKTKQTNKKTKQKKNIVQKMSTSLIVGTKLNIHGNSWASSDMLLWV